MQVIKYIKLPFQFDAAKLQAETSALADVYWKMHYNTKHYTGNWSIIPLRSLNGDLGNTYSVHASASGQIPYADTPLLQQCPYMQQVLSQLQCEKTAVRLMKLDAGAVINNHCDQDMCYEQGEIRLHIPVFTNPDVKFYIEEERIPMQPGECWYLNLQMMHRVRNDGNTDRIHFVIDCLVNDRVRGLFNDPALPVKKSADYEITTTAMSDAQKAAVIAELRRQNTPEALRLADELENG